TSPRRELVVNRLDRFAPQILITAGKLSGSGAFQLFPHHKGRIVIFGRYSSRRATALIKFSPIRHRRAASFALLLTLPLLVGATSLTASFDQPILEAHNRERAAL